MKKIIALSLCLLTSAFEVSAYNSTADQDPAGSEKIAKNHGVTNYTKDKGAALNKAITDHNVTPKEIADHVESKGGAKAALQDAYSAQDVTKYVTTNVNNQRNSKP